MAAARVLRSVSGVFRPLVPLINNGSRGVRLVSGLSIRLFGYGQAPAICSAAKALPSAGNLPRASLVSRITPLLPSLLQQPVRTLTYFSLRKGKRKSVKAVVERFFRLHCGLWLRRRAGYKKKLWKKSAARKKPLKEHVFCNKTQSKLLDKMTTAFWKRRNWYVNDPFQKYHDRTNLEV
ncbi:PREDICTED: 39S ribosomal protein L35, mitochondrial [Gavialis gangeticus]|uniref:39S ribosomal protein L35, mitochondrial n=1 Tax=Gavialis gangeticus TaxID=94835 RepID=UPI00092F71F3|nr:PREDICTED: 39S ribosomal protein L35, mitochondrial [Gavialis gangeticus]XP_019381721.1 PREDICTED: 39S ribosomal protein L35, mitochondrial [Gavialis gangeticus]